MVHTDSIHGVSDPKRMLEESEGDLLINGVVFCQNQCDLEHVLAVEGHPRGAIRLIKVSPGRKLSASIKDSNIVQAKEASREDIPTLRVFSVDPPIEVQHEALKGTFEETKVRPAELSFDIKEEQRRPGMHRGIDIAEIPYVGRDLPVGM